MRDFFRKIKEEAYIIPIVLSLFLVPIFWNPFFINSFTQGKEIFFKAIILVTCGFLTASLIKAKNFKVKNVLKSRLFILLIIEMIVFAVSNFLSPNQLVSFYGTYTRGFGYMMEIFMFVFVIYVVNFITERRAVLLIKVSVASGLILAIYGCMQKLGLDLFFQGFDINIFAGRIFSFLGNPSYLGQYMSLLSVMTVFLLFHKTKYRYFYVIVIGVFLATIVLSGTRTAVVGLFFASILAAIKYFKVILKIAKKYKYLVIGAVFLITVLVATIYSKIPENRFSISTAAFRSLESRVEIWRGAVGLIKEKPVFGHGEETFYIYFPDIVTKTFLTLEENINTSADRVHNETLQILFDHGIFGLFAYLAIFIYLAISFFKTKKALVATLSLTIIVYITQNQLGFPDIVQNILIGFCLGSIIGIEVGNWVVTVQLKKVLKYAMALSLMIVSIFFAIQGVWKPYISQRNFYESKMQYSKSYDKAVNYHKKAIFYTPYYSELWYELIFIDPSSMERALMFLEKIDGKSGNVLAWNGNLYAKQDPAKATQFFMKALERNPNNPNWIRAFADMLYANDDLEEALFMYNEYLNAMPEFWKLKESNQGANDTKRYQTFLKTTPNFEGTIKRIEEIISTLDGKNIEVK